MERDYRLWARVIHGFLGLGLLIVAGCVGAYLLWGPQMRQARLERLRGWILVVASRSRLPVEEPQQELEEVVNEVKPMTDE